MKNRPISVTILAVIGIIFALFGLLCSPFALFGTIIEPNAQMPMPMIGNWDQTVPMPTGLTILFIGNYLVTFLCAIILLIGSIGSFSMKRWARGMMNLYAGVTLIKNLIVALVQTIIMLPFIAETVQSQMGGDIPLPAVYFGAFVGILCSTLCFGMFQIAILFFFNKRSTREAFANGGMMPPPGQYGGGGGFQNQQWEQQPSPSYNSPYGPPPPGTRSRPIEFTQNEKIPLQHPCVPPKNTQTRRTNPTGLITMSRLYCHIYESDEPKGPNEPRLNKDQLLFLTPQASSLT